MPDRQEGEGRDEFIERCMADEEALRDFPDGEQRAAFCASKADEVNASEGGDQKFARDINGVEIFAAGTWHASTGKVTITEEDLDLLVGSFAEIGTTNGLKPVIKLGHSENQKLFGRKEGAPNLGFVSRVWREGQKVLANFSQVPDALFDLVRSGRYNQVSIEMRPKMEFGGRVHRNVLTGVALLGAELPAVKGLKELASVLMEAGVEQGEAEISGDGVVILSEKDETMQYSKEQVDELVEAATNKAREEVEAKFSAEKAELEARATKAEERATGAEDALRQFQADVRTQKLEGMVDKAIADGKVAPKNRDTMIALAHSMTGTVKLSEGGEKDASEAFAEFLGGLPTAVDFGERGAGGEKKEFASAQEEVTHLINKRIEDEKVSYGDAYKAVISTIPADLKRRYVEGE